MNLPPNQPMPADQSDGDEIDLLGLVDVLLEAKWLIIFTAAVVVFLGAAYAVLSTPVYEADTLIQVEDSKPNAAGALGDAANLFDIKSPASAEMEILRSRLVVGQAVDQLQLYVSATPNYIPYVGAWLAGRANDLSNPGFLGMAGYVSGREAIRLAQLEVPAALEGRSLLLVTTDQGYELRGPEGETLVNGKAGEQARFETPEGKGAVLVTQLLAKPGAHFTVRRDSRLGVVESLQSRLGISERGRQSGVIGVTLQGTDPTLVARTLNAVGNVYVKQNVDRKAAEAEKSLVFLDDFLPQLKKQLEESEGKLTSFRNSNGTFALSTEGELALTQGVALQTNLLTLQQKRRELAATFTAQHPNIQAIDQQIAAVNREIAGLTSKVTTLPNLEQDIVRLTRDVRVNSELYATLLNNLQQLRLVKEGKVGNVRVVDSPVVPEEPVKPKRKQIVAIAGILGLLLGIGLAFLRNSLRPGIKDPGEIEAVTGLNVFATVPLSPAQKKHGLAIKQHVKGKHLLAISQPDDPSVESLRSLRTALQFAMLDAPNNIVLITGPTPNIGKSFTSANFAAVLGAGGKRVLLVDADMRKGHLHQYFGLERELGFSGLITGSQRLDEVLQKNVSINVDLIPTGRLPPNPGELLLSPTTSQLLKALSAQYDLVLIDTPPVLAVSDTQVLAPNAGTVFLVARAEVSTVGEIQESARRLAQSGVQARGVIFNGLDVTRKRYGYGKYSRYNYTNYEYGTGGK
ncbi:MAG: polysaccharide biosynthesis tyrosine autokinase [Polaromonas sp.]|nr:polysaccharide biosynthesis tyrosine autokinase [Polaromonas sp.]